MQAPPATDPGEYVTRFQSALTAFEEEHYGAAAALFRRAGEQAPDAPVWRVHAAVALARADDLEGAKEAAVEALRRGYPRSDLAAIDPRLVPEDAVPADLAPTETRTVLRLGAARVPGHASATLRGDLAIVGSAAWDLFTGELVATQRSKTRSVIGRVKRPGGDWEDVLGDPDVPGRWDHVDGRVLEQPSTGRDEAVQRRRHPVDGLPDAAQARGLRTGLWVRGDGEAPEVRFLGGSALALGDEPHSWREPRAARSNVLDVATLRVRTEHGDPWQDPTIVQDGGGRAGIAELLGEPLERGDCVQRFEGLPYVVVTRGVDLAGISEERAPLLVLDPVEATVVARPRIEPDILFGVRLTPCVFASDANLLLTSNGGGSTLEALSTETWRVVWREPWQSGTGLRRKITLRGDRVYSWARSPQLTDVHDVRTGEPLLDGSDSHLTMIDGSDDGRWVAAGSWGARYLFDGRDFAPVLEFWVEPSGGALPLLTAIGVDGTFMAPEARIREAHVMIHGTFVPGVEVAAWLWDPLHVRSLRDDADRGARSVPTER